MVSVSFGNRFKSNFSEAQNSYQMTVALIMMVVVLCSISSIIVAVRSSSSQEPVPIKKQGTVEQQGPSPSKKQGTKLQGPSPSKKQSKVKITNDGIQFPKTSTTEGYLSENVSCKKLQKLEPSAFENGSMNGFSDYDSYEAHRLEYDSKRWGENGWCKLIGLTDENHTAIGYFHHDGDFKDRAFDTDTGRCKFTGEDKPYACVYKEEKDGEFITGFKNNEGKRLEVVFYNDYKAGKLDKWFEELGLGTKNKFILNDEDKLELSLNVPEKGISGSFLIKPGNNYPVQFMLLGSAIAMVDNNIPMTEDGIDIRFTSLTNDEMKKNFRDETSAIMAKEHEKVVQKRSAEKVYNYAPAYIRFYTDCSKEPVKFIEIDRNALKPDEEVFGTIKSKPGQEIKLIEMSNITILGDSQYSRYDHDRKTREETAEEWRPIMCHNQGCEKLAHYRIEDIQSVNEKIVYYDHDGTSTAIGDHFWDWCRQDGDYFKDITFNYKVSRRAPKKV